MQPGTGDGQVSQVGEVFEHGDTGVEQDRVGRPLPAAVRVVDVDAVDADQAGAGVDDQLGGRFGEERGPVPVRLGAPAEVVKSSETGCAYRAACSCSTGWLIQATSGSWGGRGRRANRSGCAA